MSAQLPCGDLKFPRFGWTGKATDKGRRKEPEGQKSKVKQEESSLREKPEPDWPRRLADWRNPEGARKVDSVVDKVTCSIPFLPYNRADAHHCESWMREICTSSLGGGRRSAPQGAPPPTRQWRSRVMPVERRGWVTRIEIGLVNWQQEEPTGIDRKGGTSRIRREAYVRFCEGLGVKIPGPTRHLETEEMVRYSDTDKPKGSETVTADLTPPRQISTLHAILNNLA